MFSFYLNIKGFEINFLVNDLPIYLYYILFSFTELKLEELSWIAFLWFISVIDYL